MTSSPSPSRSDTEQGTLALEYEKPALQQPGKYQVVALNDDYTPMDFVVEVLERFFGKDREQAVRIMLTIHTEGSAICGIFTRDIAETKAEQVIRYARECQHPLLCRVQKV